MEFRDAYEAWKAAHQAAQQAELLTLRNGPAYASALDRQQAAALRQLASQHLRTMLAASATAAAACRPPEGHEARDKALAALRGLARL